MRKAALAAITTYFAIGLILGAVMGAAIPAMNALGVLYYAAVWPGFVSAGTFHTPSPPIPAWSFTFKGRDDV